MKDQNKAAVLSRREFLKTTFLAAGAVGGAPVVKAFDHLPQSSEQIAVLAGKWYRGTQDGRILESVNAGQNWQQVANLGFAHAVEQITAQGGMLVIDVRFGRQIFALKSSDGRLWYTASWSAPTGARIV